MSRNKVVDVGGTRYTVRGLTFEEFVMLGSIGSESKDNKEIVAEVLQRCLIEPKLKSEQITGLDDKTLVTLVTIALDIAKSGLEGIGVVSMPDTPPLRDLLRFYLSFFLVHSASSFPVGNQTSPPSFASETSLSSTLRRLSLPMHSG